MLLPMPVARFLVSEPIGEVILAGIIGTLAAVCLIPVAASVLSVELRTFFVRYPTRQDAIWWLIGLGIPIGLVLIAFVLGWVQIDPGDIQPAQIIPQLLAGGAIGLWTGTVEESIMRGVLLAVIGHRWSWSGAILTTALVFGLLHHDAATGTAASLLYVGVTTTAGIFFGLVVVSTGNILNAIALHAIWNGVFNEFVLSPEPTSSGEPIAFLVDTGSVSIEGATLTESPLALLLFIVLTIGYWYWLTRNDRETDTTVK